MLDLAIYTTVKYETVESFVDIAEDVNQTIMVRVYEDGLLDEREWIRTKAAELYDGNPDVFSEYINSIKNKPKQTLFKKSQCLVNIS